MTAPTSDADDVASNADIALAAKVHYSFLPRTYSDTAVDIAVKVRPLGLLGGDYCGIFPFGDNLIVCMCDVVGHGLASAMLAARVNGFVLSHTERNAPCRLVESLNAFLCRHLSGTGLYTTFFTVFFDYRRGEMLYAGAGHPPALHYTNRRGTGEFLPSSTTILGIEHPLPTPCSVGRRPLESGDKVLLYTDGLMESRTPGGGLFGQHGMETFVEAQHGLDSAAFNEQLFDAANCYDCQIRDDILIMTVSVK
jgi:sigma-B regulation protein RsbU (phosphoserine phosphatase)